MFWTRLLSGIVLVAIQLVVLICGGPLLLVVTGAISMVGLFEYYRALELHREPAAWAGYIFTLVFYLYLFIRGEGMSAALRAAAGRLSPLMLIVCMLIALLFFYVLTYPKYDVRRITELFFGPVYVTVMLSYIYQTRVYTHGEYLVWLIFLASWGCDTCAYCAGRLFGKHHLSPELSPKKTIEGAVGGIAGVFLLNLIFLMAFKNSLTQLTVGGILLLCLLSCLGGLISMIGDLAASAIKRNVGIKDYGKLIPGHGGILDRFDSVLITAPVIYYLITMVL